MLYRGYRKSLTVPNEYEVLNKRLFFPGPLLHPSLLDCPQGKDYNEESDKARFMEVQKEEAQCQALNTYPSEQIDFGFSSS